jgi:hypothetical protein
MNNIGVDRQRRSSGLNLIRTLRKSIVGWQKIKPALACRAVQLSECLNGCATKADVTVDNCYEVKPVRASGWNDPGDHSKAQNAAVETFFKSIKGN